MAQTTIAQPQDFTPAYNPVRYIIDSTNKNKTGFKYIFDVYHGATRIGRFKVLPTFGTGYGEQDLTRFLSSYVSWDFDPSVTLDQDAVNSYYQYQVKTGEEYLAEFNYTSSLTASGTIVRVNVTNTFSIGDQINIAQVDGGTANPLVEGLHSVVNASATWFEINVPWSSVTNATIDGVVTYADNRKIVTYDIQTLTSGNVFNGARRWTEFVYWNADEYNLNDPTKYWLTNQPLTNFKATIAQDLWLNARVRVGKKIVFENSNGDLLYKTIVSNSTIQQIAVGPNNHGILTPGVGTLPLIKDDTTYYEFWYEDATQKSQKYRVDIDRRTQISEYDVVFLDRMGSYSSFAFQLKAYERGEVTREEYNQDVTGYVSGGEWTYNYEEFGYSTINLNNVKSLELNTNWQTQEMATYFEELITSPQCFLKVTQYVTTEDGLPVLDEDGCLVQVAESTQYVPIIVTTNSYEVYKQRNKNLMKQSIVVKLANNDAING